MGRKNKKRNNKKNETKEFRSKAKKNSIKRSSRHWKKRILDEVRDGIVDTEDYGYFDQQ